MDECKLPEAGTLDFDVILIIVSSTKRTKAFFSLIIRETRLKKYLIVCV